MKFLAMIGSVAVVAVSLLAVNPAMANTDNSNHESFWETAAGESCYKIDNGVPVPYVLPAAPEGKTYSKVVIKAGSGIDENKVYTTGLTAGTPFMHATKDSISHVIVCTIPTPSIVVADVPVPSFADLCGTDNDGYGLPTSTQVSYAVDDQRVNGVGTVTVTATANPGFTIEAGVTASWTFTFTDEPCDDESVSFVPAATASDVCGTDDDGYTLPTSTQVSYAVDDQRVNGVGTVTVTATANPGFTIEAGVTASWIFTFTDEPCVVVLEVLADPTMTDDCGIANDKLTVPSDSNEVSYDVDDQRADGVGTVTVTASANAGFQFADNMQTVWTIEFTDVDCPSTVVPVTPGVNGQLCFLGNFIAGSINVELNDAVAYRITGNGIDMVATKAITNVAPGNYTVTAEAKPGHVLDGKSSWQVTVAAAQACGELETHPLVTPLASMTNMGCATDGSYTLNAIEGVLWLVDGEPTAAGTYPVRTPGAVNVTAQADGPEFGLEFEAQTEWTFTFTAAEACGDLQTLAMTGGGQSMNGLLMSSGLLLLFGGVLLVMSRLKASRVE
ncbi:hypothetical protein ACX3O0_03760 [Homoserinimonas sp. A447]